MKQTIRKGRTMGLTISELMESVRLKIAITAFKEDPMLLRAILTELAMEVQKVTKNRIIRGYSTHSGLNQRDMIPFLRSIDDFERYEIFWSLSPEEIAYYQADSKFTLSTEERAELFAKIKQKFMGD